MTKTDFTELVKNEVANGGTRFCVAVTVYGEAVLYWTNAKGIRVWRVLSGNRGKQPRTPSEATRKKIITFTNWLAEITQDAL